jgi:hypothetical protein
MAEPPGTKSGSLLTPIILRKSQILFVNIVLVVRMGRSQTEVLSIVG